MSTETNELTLRLVVIGGGAAGFFAAIRAAEANPEASVILLERGKEVLGKVRISGGGRCNVTHACWDPSALVKHYPRGARELLGPFTRFACGDTVEWFERRGVVLKIEDDGRMFPVTDRSETIAGCLERAAARAGVQVRRGQRLEALHPPGEAHPHWRVQTRTGTLPADRVLVATGSNGAVWEELARLGHRIVPPVPSLFTFNIRDKRLDELAGISVPSAAIQIENSKLAASGPLLITHWGLSGPGILRLSAWGARELHDRGYRFPLLVNWLDRHPEAVRETLLAVQAEQARRQIAAQSAFELPLRLWRRLTDAAGIAPDTRWADLGKGPRQRLLEELTRGRYLVDGKSTFKEEFVTAGGVDLREVDFKTFQSKLLPGLFFAGEVLDIDAITGGFNFQAAWTGGWIAGEAMAK